MYDLHPYLSFILHHSVLWSLFALILVCLLINAQYAQFGMISVEKAIELMNRNPFMLVDLRDAQAFQSGHILNARSIPKNTVDAHGLNPESIDQIVLLVCASGYSASSVVQKLRKSGHAKAYGVQGGMAKWSQMGLPLVKGTQTVVGKKETQT